VDPSARDHWIAASRWAARLDIGVEGGCRVDGRVIPFGSRLAALAPLPPAAICQPLLTNGYFESLLPYVTAIESRSSTL